MIKYIFVFFTVLLVGCSSSKSGGRWNRGEWSDHAGNAWNTLAANVRKQGIEVRNPSRLNTKFVTADGTSGSGGNRVPYKVQNGQKLGGWHVGSCNGSGEATLVRESGGFWNLNSGTHEVGHHVNQHARCDSANNWHPSYIGKAGAPFWSFAGVKSEGVSIFRLHYQFDSGNVCLLVVGGGIEIMEDSRQKLFGFAAELVGEEGFKGKK